MNHKDDSWQVIYQKIKDDQKMMITAQTASLKSNTPNSQITNVLSVVYKEAS